MALSGQKRTYQCCQCDEDVTHLVERACRDRHVYPSVSGMTAAPLEEIDSRQRAITTVFVECSKGHLCEFDVPNNEGG